MGMLYLYCFKEKKGKWYKNNKIQEIILLFFPFRWCVGVLFYFLPIKQEPEEGELWSSVSRRVLGHEFVVNLTTPESVCAVAALRAATRSCGWWLWHGGTGIRRWEERRKALMILMTLGRWRSGGEFGLVLVSLLCATVIVMTVATFRWKEIEQASDLINVDIDS